MHDNSQLFRHHYNCILKPRVLVLLATYEGEKWLVQQIESILIQECVEVILHIMDDFSCDNTLHIIRQYSKNNSKIISHLNERKSGTAGSNFRRLFRCIDGSGYDFIALSDQDDIWHPRKLISAICALKKSGAHGYSCSVNAFWPNGRERIVLQHAQTRELDYLFEGAGQGCTFVIHPDLFFLVQKFCIHHISESEALHYHDWLIYLLARANGMKWFFDQNAWTRYRQHDNNEIGSRGGLKPIFKRLDLIRNGWYKCQIKAALKVLTIVQKHTHVSCYFKRIFMANDSLIRRFQLAWLCWRYGRRCFTDRIILMISALLAWI
jgi:rhamnosyltransferase